jgi:peptidoglycan/LPS O-acetylase OafA/YrhL
MLTRSSLGLNQPRTEDPKRIAGLDGLRGIAILLVLASHSDLYWFWFGGAVGVTLFFVLSGYLITRILLRQTPIDFMRFYARRARRLLPALIIVVAAASIFSTIKGEPGWWQRAWPALTYTASFVASSQLGDPMGNLSHTWSLAVEEQFYLLWPLLLTITRRRTVIALLVVAALLWRINITVGAPFWERVAYGSDTSALAILAGCFLAVAVWPRPNKWVGVSAVVGLVAVAAIPAHGSMTVVAGYVVVVAAGVAIQCAPAIPWLESTWLKWLGTISYGLYLWHVPLFDLVSVPWLMIPVAVGMAWVSWRIVEKPILDGRLSLRRFPGYRTRLKGPRDGPVPVAAIVEHKGPVS